MKDNLLSSYEKRMNCLQNMKIKEMDMEVTFKSLGPPPQLM